LITDDAPDVQGDNIIGNGLFTILTIASSGRVMTEIREASKPHHRFGGSFSLLGVMLNVNSDAAVKSNPSFPIPCC